MIFDFNRSLLSSSLITGRWKSNEWFQMWSLCFVRQQKNRGRKNQDSNKKASDWIRWQRNYEYNNHSFFDFICWSQFNFEDRVHQSWVYNTKTTIFLHWTIVHDFCVFHKKNFEEHDHQATEYRSSFLKYGPLVSKAVIIKKLVLKICCSSRQFLDFFTNLVLLDSC